MSTSVGVSVCVDQVYCVCFAIFMGFKTLLGLVILDMEEFNIILEISWLSPYCAILDCYAKTVPTTFLKMENLEPEGTYKPTPMKNMSTICAQNLVKWGCREFLDHL